MSSNDTTPPSGVARVRQARQFLVLAVGRWLHPRDWAPRTLVGRLMGLLLIGVVAIYAIAVAGLWWTGGKLMKDSLHKQAVQWLSELDHLGTPMYVRQSGAANLSPLTQRLAPFPEVGYVRYYDAGGERLLGEYRRGLVPPPLRATERGQAADIASSDKPYLLSEVSAPRSYIRVVAPVIVRAYARDNLLAGNGTRGRESVRIIGYLDFGLDLGYQRTAFRRSLVIGSVVIALVFAGLLLIGRRVIKRSLAPLVALQEPLTRAARGERNISLAHGGDQEIATIADALNTLLSNLRQSEQALQQAERDAITGVANRGYFLRQLERERRQVERDQSSSAVAVIVLDQHKMVRDTLGPAAADRFMAQAAGLLRAHLREDDMLARLGVDQFGALVRGVSREGAVKVAGAIARLIDDFHFLDGERSYAGGAVIGVAMLDTARAVPEAVISQAEAAVAQARTRGNAIAVHETEPGGEARRTATASWAIQLRDAIREDRFELLYQPIVPLHAIAGDERYEVLLRLKASGGELISPAAFLPIANRSGLLPEIDAWVIRRALAALAEFRAHGRNIQLFLNLSGQAFDDGERLLHIIGEALHCQQLPGSAVVFEITEQVAVRQLERARGVLEAVQALQCSFALDDFGSGFSSLTYLKHLPVSYIKIAGSFVEQMVAGAADEAVVRSIVDIARALGKQTIAESVENRQCLRLLTNLGADYGQGYYLGKPARTLPARASTTLRLLDGKQGKPG